MPALYVACAVRQFEPAKVETQVDRDLRYDIRNCIAVARDELPLRQYRVEPFDPLQPVITPRFTEFRKLLYPISEQRMGMLHEVPNRLGDLELHATAPHFDESRIARIDAHQRGLGIDAFEIAADGDRFCQIGTVVELEHRQRAQRVFVHELDCPMLVFEDVHMDINHLDVLFGEKNSHSPRIGRQGKIVNFHGVMIRAIGNPGQTTASAVMSTADRCLFRCFGVAAAKGLIARLIFGVWRIQARKGCPALDLPKYPRFELFLLGRGFHNIG
jgi:hypothetical protein